LEGKPEMTELEILARDINVLTELLSVARRDVKNPLLTPFERREANNQIDLCVIQLRRHLQWMKTERCRFPNTILEKMKGASFGQTKIFDFLCGLA
jgi:hypothetical protein